MRNAVFLAGCALKKLRATHRQNCHGGRRDDDDEINGIHRRRRRCRRRVDGSNASRERAGERASERAGE